MIDRPQIDFDAIAHAYTDETGQTMAGVSSVAKIGGADDTWGIASAWGFRLGYEGAWDIVNGRPLPKVKDDDGNVLETESKDKLRAHLMAAGLTPWATRDRAADRGSWVHDVLENLGQSGDIPDLLDFPEEVRLHALSLCRWFLAFRPEFVALEVQVGSRTHGFAGRYDVRALIEAKRLLPCIDPIRQDPQAVRIRELAAEGKKALGLLDLKTSKGIYPTTHFPQLEGYEGGGVEMGFPATDFRGVINTNADGTFDPVTGMAVSWATYDDFLGLLQAFRAIRRMKDGDPELLRKRAAEAALLADGVLPATSAELAKRNLDGLDGFDSRAIGRMLGKMAKAGKVARDGKGWKVA